MRQNILLEALKLCQKRCDCSNYHHFCVVFRGKKILATGFNCFCRNMRHLGAAQSVHAELNAIQKIKDKRRSFDMLVIRTNKTMTGLMNSKPCLRCERWLSNYPVNKIYFSTETGISYIYGTQLAKTFKHNVTHRPISCKAASGFRIPICLSLFTCC